MSSSTATPTPTTSSLLAPNLFNVNNLVAVITGGGSGIGLMLTQALSHNGASKIYIIGRRASVLEEASKSTPHNNIIPIVGDVTSKASLTSIVQKISAETGYINLLIANSGILGPQANPRVTPDISLEEFQKRFWDGEVEEGEFTRTFEVNTTGVWYSVMAFLGLLGKGNQKGNVEVRSQIVVTSSIGGFNRATPGGYAYGQSKAAVTHLAKQLATGLVPYGIRVNTLAPGLFPSDLAAGIIGDGVFPKEKLPAERVGTAEEMAGSILYLASKAGGYCNGLVLLVDGGRLSVLPATY